MEICCPYWGCCQKAPGVILPPGSYGISTDGRTTFMEWCESPFSSSGSARRLRLHRNSLQYRLKKIRALTGKDPWKFKDAFDLWVAFSLKDMENLKS